MVTKYRFGTPVSTYAVAEELPESGGKLPYFAEENGVFTLRLNESDIVYGLGEQSRGINKRGWTYTSCAADNCNHQEDTQSLYGVHNFLLISGEERFGAFFDCPAIMHFDVGYTRRDTLTITSESPDMDIYIITGDSDRDIVKQFRQLIGRSYIAPKWGFGYGQSRWGYKNEADIREVARQYKALGVPIDSIYLDIDYMERYKDFTVDSGAFPDLPGLIKDMRAEGIHLVPIIDAGVKIEEGYSVYEEGVANGYFCKDADGKDFVGAVWPGRVHFPDFLKADTRRWFGDKYSVLLDMGIDGFWNDMNEPAIFYTEERLKSVIDRVNELSGKNMGIFEYFEFTGIVAGISNNIGDYDLFYHDVEGKKLPHRAVHNLYGYNMTRAAGEAFQRISPDKRILMFSRSSYIGAHRYGGIWQGDNKSWWSHLLMNMQMMASLNMAGFLFTGADVGGFGSNTTEDLMLRWLQLAVFTPLMRNHAALGTREQELYRFANADTLKKMIELRYALIPYLYSEYMKAVLTDDMMFRPLAFDFPEDKYARGVEDQLLLGNEVMIAPVYTQNAEGRYVYLPEDMMLVRAKSTTDIVLTELSKGHHYVDIALDELVFFIRSGKAIPFAKTAANTAEIDYGSLALIGYSAAEYQLYNDDGTTTEYGFEGHLTTIEQ